MLTSITGLLHGRYSILKIPIISLGRTAYMCGGFGNKTINQQLQET